MDDEIDGDDTELKNKARRGPRGKSGKRRHTSHSGALSQTQEGGDDSSRPVPVLTVLMSGKEV